MGKKEFWSTIHTVDCPECGKPYQHRSAMIAHMVRVHDYAFAKARDTVDELGIYVPEHSRR